MRALVARSWELDEFSVEELPDPEPGPGEVLVVVGLAGLSFGDVLIATGRYQVRPSLPFVPGSEGIGVVLEVGEAVAGFRRGDKVMFYGFHRGPQNHCRVIGTLAEQVIVPVTNLLHQPEGMGDAEAVLFRASYETAYHALQVGRLVEGETLLVLGAAGATGLAAVEIGKALGAYVVASASTPEKQAIATAGGADVVLATGSAQWRTEVAEASGGHGVDVVFDPVGGDLTELAFRCLAWQGRHVVVGFASGAIPHLPANLPLLKGGSLVGSNLLRFNEQFPAEAAQNIEALVRLYRAGKLCIPAPIRRVGLDGVAEAMAAVEDGALIGRVVVDPGM